MRKQAVFLLLLLVFGGVVVLATPPATVDAALFTGVLRYRWDMGNNTFAHTNVYTYDEPGTGTVIITDSETGHNTGFMRITHPTARYYNTCKLVIDWDSEGYPEQNFFVRVYYDQGAGPQQLGPYYQAATGVQTITFNYTIDITVIEFGWTNKDALDMAFVEANYLYLYTANQNWRDVESWNLELYTRNRVWSFVEQWFIDVLGHTWIPIPTQDPNFFLFLGGAVGTAFSGTVLLGKVKAKDPDGAYGWATILVLCGALMLGALL